MSLCRIERTIDDVSETLARAKQEAVKFGSVWEGDVDRGHYVLRTPLGAIEGTYTVRSGTASFLIEKKPVIVPCALIKRVLDEFLRASAKGAM
jgi:hypothetical protein